jgi:hypothetical protein
VRECVEEVRYPRRGIVASTEIEEFQFDLLLKPKVREVKKPMDCPSDGEGVYSTGGTNM